MARKALQAILILTLLLAFNGAGIKQAEAQSPDLAAAEELSTPKEETRERTLDGEVAGVSPNFLAIDYAQDSKASYEMTFNITKDTRLERIKDVRELKPGDTVWVSYREKIIRTGKEIRVLERVLKVLRLLNAAKVIPEPVAQKVEEAEEEALEEEEEESEE